MNSRTILETYGMDKTEVLNIISYILPDLTLQELTDLLIDVQSEFEFRDEHDLLGDDE